MSTIDHRLYIRDLSLITCLPLDICWLTLTVSGGKTWAPAAANLHACLHHLSGTLMIDCVTSSAVVEKHCILHRVMTVLAGSSLQSCMMLMQHTCMVFRGPYVLSCNCCNWFHRLLACSVLVDVMIRLSMSVLIMTSFIVMCVITIVGCMLAG